MGKKDKKNKEHEEPPDAVLQEEVLVATTDLEPEPPEVQYTDTSYTSASFESLPPVVEEVKVKKKKGKKKAEEAVEEVTKKTSSELFQWSEESLPLEEQVQKVEEEQVVVKKKGKKKGKKEKEEIPDFEKPKNWKKMNKKERELWLQQRIEEWRAEKEAEKQAILAGAKEKRATLARERAELMARDHAEEDIRRDILAKTCTLFHRFENEKFDFGRKKQLEAEWQQYLRCDGLPDPRVSTQMNTYIHLWRETENCDDNELDKRCQEALPMLEMLEEFVADSRQYTPLQARSYNEVRIALRAQLSEAIQCASFTLLRDLESRLKWDSIKLATYQREFKGLRLNIWVAVPLPTRKPKPVEPEREPVELSFPSMKVAVKLPKIIDGSRVCVRAAHSMIDLLSESSRSFALAAEMPNRYLGVLSSGANPGNIIKSCLSKTCISVETEPELQLKRTPGSGSNLAYLFIFNVKEHVATYKLKKEQDDIRNKFYKEIREKIKEVEAFLKANQYTKNEKEKDELDNLNMAEPPFLQDPRTEISEQNVQISDSDFCIQNLQWRSQSRSSYNSSSAEENKGWYYSDYLRESGNTNQITSCESKSGEEQVDKGKKTYKPRHVSETSGPTSAQGNPGVQPSKDFVSASTSGRANTVVLSQVLIPKQLRPMKYQVQYRAPSPPPLGVTRTPEEIEAEMKKIEMQYEKLALVCIDLPQDVMWSEPPVICQWQDSRKLWTSNYVNDYKFNEDKLTVQFRTGVLWPIGIATLRYGNLPYQGWDIRPDPNSKGVIITVTGVCVTVTWVCIGNTVKLKWIANATTSALKEHFDKPYSVKRMVQIMREAACDFFPDFDAHSHVDGSCPKEWVSERHNYHAMAFLSRSYNFQWSRWNISAGSRNIIMQIREAVDKKREAKFQLLQVSPQRASILKCIELSQEFNLEPMLGFPFYPDLFTLNMSYGSVDARRATFSMKYRLVETVFEMLQELKLSSYS